MLVNVIQYSLGRFIWRIAALDNFTVVVESVVYMVTETRWRISIRVGIVSVDLKDVWLPRVQVEVHNCVTMTL